jgi:hypothetical protein
MFMGVCCFFLTSKGCVQGGNNNNENKKAILFLQKTQLQREEFTKCLSIYINIVLQIDITVQGKGGSAQYYFGAHPGAWYVGIPKRESRCDD